jgi:hypothetical protein
LNNVTFRGRNYFGRVNNGAAFYLGVAYAAVVGRKSTFLDFLIQQAGAPDERMKRWK